MEYAMEMLPTPTASDFQQRYKTENWQGGDLVSTINEMTGLIPTPCASDSNGGGTGETDYAKKHAKDKLKYTAVRGMLPTPTHGDGHKTTSNTRQVNLNYFAEAGSGFQLSALFVEEMMGFPEGWTASPFQSGDEKA
jgi:hypothetical protein